LRELKSILDRADPYEMLRASAILRQLLMDGSNLMDQVNRTCRVKKLRFAAVDQREMFAFASTVKGIDVLSIPDSIDPAMGIGRVVGEFSRDQLLKLPVAYHKPDTYTVGEIIEIAANVRGGVHPGEPRNEEESGLIGVSEKYRFDLQGVPFDLYYLRGIAKVVIRGLTPLRDEVRKKKSIRPDQPT
jgi:hypothetical protein